VPHVSDVQSFGLTPCPAAPKSPPKKPAVVRRTSSVTEEDRENAIKIRKNALKSNGGMSSSLFVHKLIL
jgi:hypothetical protein